MKKLIYKLLIAIDFYFWIDKEFIIYKIINSKESLSEAIEEMYSIRFTSLALKYNIDNYVNFKRLYFLNTLLSHIDFKNLSRMNVNLISENNYLLDNFKLIVSKVTEYIYSDIFIKRLSDESSSDSIKIYNDKDIVKNLKSYKNDLGTCFSFEVEMNSDDTLTIIVGIEKISRNSKSKSA
jgi:hypothetical protein